MGRNLHRARRSDGLPGLLKGDWPVAGALALAAAVIGVWMMSAWFIHSPLLARLPLAFKPFVWGLFGFFTLVAIMKYRFARRAESIRRMQEHLEREQAAPES